MSTKSSREEVLRWFESAVHKVHMFSPMSLSVHWDDQIIRLVYSYLHDGTLHLLDIHEGFNIRLKQIGRECYEYHLQGEQPDHTLSPYAFAYAIYHGEFSPRELEAMSLDERGIRSFVFAYNPEDRIRHMVIEKLLGPHIVDRVPRS